MDSTRELFGARSDAAGKSVRVVVGRASCSDEFDITETSAPCSSRRAAHSNAPSSTASYYCVLRNKNLNDTLLGCITRPERVILVITQGGAPNVIVVVV